MVGLVWFWGYPTAAQFLVTQRSSPRVTRSTRTSRRSSPSRHPCGAQLPRVPYLFYASTYSVSDIFVIYVINNIGTRFIISFYVVYTCDLILARIWLLGLCPFVNRVLHIAIMHLWKEADAFHNPKGILRYAKVPYGQVNVVLCWSSGWIGIWKNPEYPSG